jgi:hypothetical protein
MDNETQPPAGRELHSAPPFLTWNGLYGLVVGALLLEILFFTALTLAYR